MAETTMTRDAALARLARLARRYVQSATERYEDDAERFYRATGFLAPGKSVPLAMYQNEDERHKAWQAWLTEERAKDADAIARAQQALEIVARLPQCPECGPCRIDEDGCCTGCGADATQASIDQAPKEQAHPMWRQGWDAAVAAVERGEAVEYWQDEMQPLKPEGE